MFGQPSGTGSAFGGFGANNTNNTTTPSLFGSTATTSTPAFGTNTATTAGTSFGQQSGFGTSNTTGTGLFGQNNNQSSGFGGFGAASRPTFGAANTGFGSTSGGIFGSTPNTTQNTTSPFGGGGAFGTTNNAATTSPFGQTNTTSTGTGLFGSTTSKPAFGSFGSSSTPAATTSTFGGSFGSSIGTTNQGTAATPFAPVQEKEPSSNVTNMFQSITCMPAYQKFSFEELREQDYAQGRRYGNNTGAGAFGKSTGFGSGTFGQTNTSTFGQPATSTGSGGLFGSTPAQHTGFGSTSAFGTNTNTGGGLFGQKPATGGLFGANTTTPTTGTGLFGNNANTTSTFGSGSTSAFGQPAATNAFGSTSAFGQNNTTQNKPAFGATGTTGFGGFGASNTATSQPTTFGGFGASTSTPAFGTNNASTGLFGNNTANTTAPAFGQPATTSTSTFGGFNATNNTAAQPSTFGGFGSTVNNNQAKPTFGGSFGAAPAANTTPSLFGNNQQNQNKPLSFGGFGQTQNNQPASGGMFGSTSTAPQTGTSLFSTGTASSGTGLFGSNNNQQTGNSGGLFGAKPATNLFGTNQAQNTNSTLFPSNTATSGGFGNTSTFGNNQAQGNSVFGNSQLGNSAQSNPLQASIDQNPFGANPLFSYPNQSATSSPGPIATPLSSSAAQKKKPAMLPTYKLSPRPIASPRPRSSTRSVSGSYSNGNGSTPNVSISRSMLFDGLADKAILSSDAFSPRNDIRKLVIDRKVSEADLLSGGSDLGKYNDSPRKDATKDADKRVTFSSEQKQMVEIPSAVPKLPSQINIANNASTPERPATPKLASPEKPKMNLPAIVSTATSSTLSAGTASPVLTNDGYWSSPSAAVLSKMSLEELEHVRNFKVGRKGYGEVTFDQPVDLTAFAHPEQIPGQLVLFGLKACTVYPDDSIKPPEGQGLNVPATITLERCYPVARDTKQPITEVDHPLVPIHIERLRSVKDTHFITYIAESGSWVFKVDHFSIWGLLEGEDEYETDAEPVTVKTVPQPVSDAPNTQSFRPSFFAPPVESESTFSPMKVDSAPQAASVVQDTSMHSPLIGSAARPSLPGAWNTESSYEYLVDDTPLKGKSFFGQGGVFKNTKPASSFDVRSPETIDISVPTYSDEDDVISDEEREDSYIEREDAPDLPSMVQDDGSSIVDDEPIVVPVGRDWLEQLKLAQSGRSLWAMVSEEKAELANKMPTVSHLDDYKFTFADLDAEIFGGDNFFGGSENRTANNAAPRHGTAPLFSPDGVILMISKNEIVASKIDNSVSNFQVDSDFLDVYLSKSSITLREEGLPLFRPNSLLSFRDILSTKSMQEDRNLTNVWKLASILFDDITIDNDSVNPEADIKIATELLRKSQLSEFFELIVEKDVSGDLGVLSKEDAVFILLSGHQIEAACIEAVKDKNLHLAALLPLIGGDTDFRRDIRNQIDDWRAKKVLSNVPLSIRRIYELLSGNTSIAEGSSGNFSEDNAPEICVSKGLDWKRAFGLRLWYEIYEEETIDKAVNSYTEAFESIADVQSPVPSYVKDESDSGRRDILYELLKIFADPTYAIAPAVMPSNVGHQPLNYAVSWLLFNILSHAKKIRHGEEKFEDQLSVDFAWQLETSGKWTDALFVLLHIRNASVCRKSVQEVLNKHAAEIIKNGMIEEYLLSTLQIPKVLLLIAKALYSRYTHDSVSEVKYLLHASQWTEAHSVIIRTVGPQSVIAESLDDLLELISRFDDVTSISNWNVGGQVYLDFINVVKSSKGENADEWWPKQVRGLPFPGTSVEDSMSRLRNSLRQIDTSSLGFTSMVAVQEMAKVVGVDVK